MSALEAMASATKPRVLVSLILDAALDAEWTRLQSELAEAAQAELRVGPDPSASLANPRPRVADKARQMEDLRERVEASRVTFVFEGLDWPARLALQLEHPPRPGNRIDELRGYNTETYIAALIRASCVQVTSASDEGSEVPERLWDTFLPNLSFGQFDQLAQGATEANDGSPQVPPSAHFLLEPQDSEVSSQPPSPGTPARSDSEAGSRRTSRKSSGTRKAGSSAS